MRNRKVYLSIITAFIILFIIFSAIIIKNTVYAKDFPVFAHEGYNTLLGYGVTSLDSTSWNDGDRQWCSQTMCIEKQANDTDGPLYIYAIIDINKNGNDPTYGEITFRTSSDSGVTTTATVSTHSSDLARLAYISASAEINHVNCSSHTDTTKNVSWMHKHSFLYLWEQCGLRNTLNGLDTRLSLPTSIDKGNKGSVYNNADAYAESVANGTNTQSYSARVIVFKGGWLQTTAILSGKVADIPKPEINKYISQVVDADGNVIDFSERASLNQSEKYASPVEVAPTSKITYTIEIKGEGTDEVTVIDSYDSAGLSYVTSGLGTDLKHKMKPGDTITITLEAKEVVSGGTKYENKATIYEYSKTSSDYIKIKYEEEFKEVEENASGNYKKYITQINGVDIEDRSGYDNSTAKANPVTVKQGDTVTYELEVTNTSSVDINNLTITDTMQSGLSYNGSTTFTYNFGSVAAGKSASTSVIVNVTKSNMYLQPLENKFVITSGTYEQRHTKDHYIIWWDLLGNRHRTYHCTRTWYTTENINTSWFSSNANADYVQLDKVEIAGDVWLDSNENGVMDSGESKLSGIPVKLYKNGSYLDSRTTNENGHYTFGKVEKGNLLYNNGTRFYADGSGYNSYYVEFEYFGVKYRNTIYTGATGVTDSGTSNNWNSKSHASEANVSTNNRTNFNNSLETIAYNQAYASSDATGAKALEYEKSGHTSTLKWTDTTTIKAKSLDLFVQVTGGDTMYADHVEYLKHINLGLVEREQSDLSLKKDVMKAELKVNGYTATYDYGALGTGDYVGEYKLQKPYELSIYKADYNFRYDSYTGLDGLKTEDDELKIKLTYKVTITNESDTYYATIREVIDISANSLTLNTSNVKLDTGDELTVSNSSTYNSQISYSYSGYQVHYITDLDRVLGPNESTSFELEYTVNKDSNRAIILGEKANVAQIGAYSIYIDGSENTPAGVVDQDSNPGIVNPEVISSLPDDTLYEDHTYYTSIILKVLPENPGPPKTKYVRQITGNVWEDLNTEELASGQMTGDGVRNTNESGAQNVTVVLLEVVEKDGKEYLVDTGITTKTDSNGDYVLKDTEKLHAGQYIVRFIYGNNPSEFEYENSAGDTIKFSGQDYKSTVYTPAGEATNEDEVLEGTAFAELKANNSDKQVSVARDNELRRLEVIDYSTTMTYVLDNILKAQANDSTTKQTLADNTSMFADTKKFNIQVEKIGQDGVNLALDKSEKVDGLKTYYYSIDEVNFGLIERPVTKLELMDDIKEITAVTASGEEILHIYFDISYKLDSSTQRVVREIKLNEVLSIGDENVQMLDRTSSTKGFRYVNIDSELLQGMKITIKYQFAIANIGDIDTSNQNLIEMVQEYNVGNVANRISAAIPSTLVDYGTSSGINENLMKNYSFKNMKSAIDVFKGTTYGKYRTVINGTTNNKDYELGYFLGSSYYDDYDSSTDKTVETRVDQIISYVDNDLVFSPSDNIETFVKGGNELQAEKFLNYTIAEIADKDLLKGIVPGITEEAAKAILSDGTVSYIEGERNNLAFNVEDEDVNSGLYQFLTPIKNVTEVQTGDMYIIELEASRVLASQLDVENVTLDNLTEIVKITNTVGRKAYIEFIDTSTGNIITPGPSGPTGYLGDTPDILEDPDESTVGKKEIDTNFTETVTFSPPTGLSQTQQATRKVNTVFVSIMVVIIVIATGGSVLYLVTKKKIYK